VLALAALFLLLQAARSGEPLALDQGLFACFGEWPGRLPYRDILDSKPPLFLYTWTLAWQLGRSATAVWWFEAAWMAIAMGLAGRLAARLWGRWAGLAAAALLFLGLWAPDFGGWWSRAQAEELMAIPVLGAAWLALPAVDRPRLALWVGVLSGVAGLYKIPAMAIAGAWPVLWLASGGWRPAAVRVGWMVAGLLLPWLTAGLWFAAHGALGDFYRAAFVYHRHNAQYIAPPWGITLRSYASTMADALAPMLVAAAIGLVGLWRTQRRHAWWLTPWVVLTGASGLLQRQLAGYQYLLVVPGLAMAAASGLTWMAGGVRRGAPRWRVAAAAGLLAVVVLAGLEVGDWRRGYGPGFAYRFGDLSRSDYLRSFEVGLLSPRVEEEAAAYLRSHSEPGDGLLIWGLSPGIYALSGRHPVTRYPFHKLLMTEAPLSLLIPGLEERRADFMRRLEADPPAYILVGTRDRNGFEPQDSVTGMMRFERFFRFVDQGYREETRIGRFVVLRRIE